MAKATPAQVRKISTLISQQHFTVELKESLVHQFTNGRTKSRKDMSIAEAALLIRFLSKDDPCTKMRNKVFAICHDLGWLYKGMHELNLLIINRFLMRRGAIKKELQRMNREELQLVVSQFQRIDAKAFDGELNEVLSELGINRATGKKLGI